MKKLLSIGLCISMMLTMLAVPAFAEEAPEKELHESRDFAQRMYTEDHAAEKFDAMISPELPIMPELHTDGDYDWYEEYGNVVIAKYHGTEKNIVVPQKIGGKKIDSIETEAFSGAEIESIELLPGIQYFHGWVDTFFENCPNLKKLTFPRTLRDLYGSANNLDHKVTVYAPLHTPAAEWAQRAGGMILYAPLYKPATGIVIHEPELHRTFYSEAVPDFTVEPANCTEEVEFEIFDPSMMHFNGATVSTNNQEGAAKIRIKCGNASADYWVIVRDLWIRKEQMGEAWCLNIGQPEKMVVYSPDGPVPATNWRIRDWDDGTITADGVLTINNGGALVSADCVYQGMPFTAQNYQIAYDRYTEATNGAQIETAHPVPSRKDGSGIWREGWELYTPGATMHKISFAPECKTEFYGTSVDLMGSAGDFQSIDLAEVDPDKVYTVYGDTMEVEYWKSGAVPEQWGIKLEYCEAFYTPVAMPQQVALDKTELVMHVGEQAHVTVTVLPENAVNKTLEYYSDNYEIAFLDNQYNIHAEQPGITEISFITFNGIEATCKVTVLPEGESVQHTPGWHRINKCWYYGDESGKPLTGVNYIAAENQFYIFSETGELLCGDRNGDQPFGGNLYFINPQCNLETPSSCYFVRNYSRVRPGVGITYYNNEGITYVGWVNSADAEGNPIKLYQTKVNVNGEDLYIYVWRAQNLPAWTNPVTGETTPAGLYLFGDDGILKTSEGWYRNETWPEGDNMYYVLPDGTAAKGVRYIDGEFYIFSDDGRLLTGDENGDQMFNGNLYYYPEGQRYFVRNYSRVRPGVGITYYNNEGITYVGWVSSTDAEGNPIRLYQTKVNVDGKDLYIYVWRAQQIPEWTNPVTGEVTPAGFYLFGDDGVLITEDGIYECGDGNTYIVEGGVIVSTIG